MVTRALRRATDPLLVAAASNTRAADDPEVAWVVSRTPADQLGLAPKTTDLVATSTIRSSADVDDADWWLNERWRTAEKLRPVGTHERPYLWENYLQHLLLAEQLRSAGLAFSDELIRVETLVERFELRLETFQVTNTSRLPSLRLRRIARMQMGSPVEPQIAAWKEAMIQYVTEPPPPGTPVPAGQPLPLSPGGWLDTTIVAWDWLVEQVGEGRVVDRDMLARWLERVGDKPATLVAEPVQVHVARMMLRWVDPAVWQAAPHLPGKLLRLISISRDAAYPRDVRADRVVEAFTPRVEFDKKHGLHSTSCSSETQRLSSVPAAWRRSARRGSKRSTRSPMRRRTRSFSAM